MKKSVLLLLVIFVLGAAGCSLIRPRLLRPNWKWDGQFRVMPNSIFEPVAKAREAVSEPAQFRAGSGLSLREELSLGGPWRYRPDPVESGEAEKWQAPELDDSGWKTMAVPNNYSIDDLSLKNFYQPVWFRRSFEIPASFSGKHLRLTFESVDYFARVWLNGEILGDHEGYFSPFAFDVTGRVRPGRNVLVVKVTNPWDMGMESAEKHFAVATAEKVWVKSVFTFHDSRMGGDSGSATDSQSFGTGGICRPVKIIATGKAALDWVLISQGSLTTTPGRRWPSTCSSPTSSPRPETP